MKYSLKNILIIFFFFFTVNQVSAQSTGDFRTHVSGNWNDVNTWERYQGSSWVTPAPSTPTSSSGAITILNTHTVTVTASVTVDQTTVDAGGQININSSCTYTVSKSASTTDMTLNGTIAVSGVLYFNANSGSWMNNNIGSPGIINVASGGLLKVDTRSIVTVSGVINAVSGSSIKVEGGNVGTRGSLVAASGGVINSYGTMTLSLGSITINSNGTVNVPSGGIMYITSNSAMQVDFGGLLSVVGNIDVGGGSINSSNIVLNGTVSLMGDNGNWYTHEGNGTPVSITMNPSSTLIMGPNSTITSNTNTPDFLLDSAATMYIGAATGIAPTGTYTGHIQVTGNHTYSTKANYIYNGVAAQVTGAGLPSSVNNLTIDNPGHIVTFSNAAGTTVNGTLTLSNGIFRSTSSKLLSVANTLTSAVTGNYSNSTYVDGPLKRYTAANSEYLFPVGNLGLFKKAGVIPVLSSSANYTVEAFSTSPLNRNNLGPGVYAVSSVEEWEIDGTAASQTKLYWTAISGVNESMLSSLYVDCYDIAASLWQTKGNSVTDNVLDYIISNSFNSNGRHTFGTANYSLPINLLYFNAEKSGGQVLLNWATASEENNDYFSVQKSADGKVFSEMDKVKGNGNSSVSKYYSYADDRPFTGINYYRLVQFDYDGTPHYLPVRAVKTSSALNQIVLFPNPSNGKNLPSIYYSGENESEVSILIHDMSGKLLSEMTNVILQPGINKIAEEKLPLVEGLYYLTVISLYSGDNYYQKLVVTGN